MHPIGLVLFEGALSLSGDELDSEAMLDSGDECRGRHVGKIGETKSGVQKRPATLLLTIEESLTIHRIILEVLAKEVELVLVDLLTQSFLSILGGGKSCSGS